MFALKIFYHAFEPRTKRHVGRRSFFGCLWRSRTGIAQHVVVPSHIDIPGQLQVAFMIIVFKLNKSFIIY